VVVANVRARSSRAEAEKGFTRTAIGRELADPKPEINFEKGTIGARSGSFRGFAGVVGAVPSTAKGKSVEIPTFGSGAIKRSSEIPCRVSSDLHEWSNDFRTVSERDSAKLK